MEGYFRSLLKRLDTKRSQFLRSSTEDMTQEAERIDELRWFAEQAWNLG